MSKSISISGWSGTTSRKFTLTVEQQSQDVVANTSKVKWTLKVAGDTTYYDTHIKCVVGGETVFNKTVRWDGGFPAEPGTKSGTVTVSHNATSGKGSCAFSIEGYACSHTNKSASDTLTLDTIDRTAPTISLSASAVSTTSLKFTATASATCNKWEYSLDGGSWVSYSTTAATSAAKTITGLSSGSHTVRVRGTKKTNNITGISSTKTVDLVAPTITFSLSDVTRDSVTVNMSSNTACSQWQYSLDNGSTWVTLSTTSGTSASGTITNLSVNTEYTIIVRAKKTSNGLYGVSSASKSFTTVGGAILISANPCYPYAGDNNNVKFIYDLHVDGYYFKLEIKDGTTVILSRQVLLGYSPSGYITASIDVSGSDLSLLRNAIPTNSKNKTVTLCLSTYENYSGGVYSNQVGNTSTCNLELCTSQEDSGPTLAGSVTDINQASVSVTGDNTVLIRNVSTAHCVMTASPKNGASIVTKKLNDMVLPSSTSYYDYVNVPVSSFTFYVKDSRGYEVYYTVNPTVVDYTPVTIIATPERVAPVSGNQIKLLLSGRFFNGNIGSNRNKLVVSYFYKETDSQDYTGPVYIIDQDGVPVAGTTVSTTASAYTLEYISPNIQSSSHIDFDYTKSYNIRITATDGLSTAIAEVTIARGIPIFDWGKDDFQFNVDVNMGDIMHSFNTNEYAYIAALLAESYDAEKSYEKGAFVVDDDYVYESLQDSNTGHTPSPNANDYWLKLGPKADVDPGGGGGGGGGGTSDYTQLTNKPQINGITLIGNKTTEDLGIDQISIDSALSTDSENAVQNKIITIALDEKIDVDSSISNYWIETELN